MHGHDRRVPEELVERDAVVIVEVELRDQLLELLWVATENAVRNIPGIEVRCSGA